MSLGGQDIQNLILPEQPSNTPGGKGGAISTSGERFGATPGSKGGALAPEDAQALRYYIASQPAVIEAFNNAGAIVDPTALAQQAILTRPMRPSFSGQPLLSREVPMSIQGNSGLAYPGMNQTGLLIPTYISRYNDSGGGGGDGFSSGGFDSSGNSLSNGLVGGLLGLSAGPSMGIAVDNMGTYGNQGAFGYGSSMTGVGNPGETAEGMGVSGYGDFSGDVGGFGDAGDSSGSGVGGFSGDVGGFGDAAGGFGSGDSGDAGGGDAGGGDAGGGDAGGGGGDGGGGGGGGGGKIVCTAMNQQYGFGSFRNAIWLKYSESNLTKAHEVGYHAIFLPLVDFAFKQGDGKLNMLTRKFLENCARHRSLDLRAEMRGTKRDTIGMIYRSVLEPLCYAVGKFKGY